MRRQVWYTETHTVRTVPYHYRRSCCTLDTAHCLVQALYLSAPRRLELYVQVDPKGLSDTVLDLRVRPSSFMRGPVVSSLGDVRQDDLRRTRFGRSSRFLRFFGSRTSQTDSDENPPRGYFLEPSRVVIVSFLSYAPRITSLSRAVCFRIRSSFRSGSRRPGWAWQGWRGMTLRGTGVGGLDRSGIRERSRRLRISVQYQLELLLSLSQTRSRR